MCPVFPQQQTSLGRHVRLVPIADIHHHLFSAVVIALIRLVQFGGPGLATVSSRFSYLISQVALWLTI